LAVPNNEVRLILLVLALLLLALLTVLVPRWLPLGP